MGIIDEVAGLHFASRTRNRRDGRHVIRQFSPYTLPIALCIPRHTLLLPSAPLALSVLYGRVDGASQRSAYQASKPQGEEYQRHSGPTGPHVSTLSRTVTSAAAAPIAVTVHH